MSFCHCEVVEAIVNAAQTILLPEDSITSRFSVTLGVGRFLDANTADPLLLAVVGRVDVFTIWVTVLFAIGMSVVGRISMWRATPVALAIWVFGALPAVWGAVRAM